jgi:subtilisin family serine protease
MYTAVVGTVVCIVLAEAHLQAEYVKYRPDLWHIYQHNVSAAWNLGYNGSGVVVTVVDDGLDWRQRDINASYDSCASYDFVEFDADPTPLPTSQHGTRCAGVIAASLDSHCALGVAFGAKVGAIRLLNRYLSTDMYAYA